MGEGNFPHGAMFGEAFARNRIESRPLTYECTLNDRTNRVLASNYELRGGRWNSVLR